MIDDQLVEGMKVHDVEGKHIGKVVRFDDTLGYFESQGEFSGPRYIPFWAIDHYAENGVYLNVERSVVTEVYSRLPQVRPDVTPEGTLAGGAEIQSGLTGKMVPLDAQGVREVKERVHTGIQVRDADDEKIGRVEAYDASSGYMRIAKDDAQTDDLFVPVTSVSYLDDRGVHLSEYRRTIESRFNHVPDVARAFFQM